MKEKNLLKSNYWKSSSYIQNNQSSLIIKNKQPDQIRVQSECWLFDNYFIMQKNFYNSRSVVVDPIFKKTMENSYHLHKKKLQSIKNRKSDIEPQVHQDIIKRKLSHKISVNRVTEQFNASHNEKRSLVRHIAQIITRKPDAVSEYKRYKNKYQQNEKLEIKRQNKLLMEKIAESKSNKLTKKDLKKQFRQYQSQKNLLRKVHYETAQKPKNKKKDHSYEVSDRQHK